MWFRVPVKAPDADFGVVKRASQAFHLDRGRTSLEVMCVQVPAALMAGQIQAYRAGTSIADPPRNRCRLKTGVRWGGLAAQCSWEAQLPHGCRLCTSTELSQNMCVVRYVSKSTMSHRWA